MTPSTVWKPQSYWLIADRLVLVAPTATGEDKVPFPDEKSCHTSTSLTNRGEKRRSSESIPLRTVWRSQPLWLIADWLGFVEPAPLEEDKAPSQNHESLRTSTTPTSQVRKRWSPESIPLRMVLKPQLDRLIADWPGFIEFRHTRGG